ncbi:acyltransferase [Belnapia rosea]|uniref:Acetyltransferase (Isoleucine patch superfamily) n=1 Tax=Belnapia rosea TaxID=938405 RepID=A0A1G6ZY00_9PROT|nr:acyltransferase [Belnapia rosea]SDB69289.1 Acetyltransferase (isoleucine patch superfamily) [Belnapia rosea]SDE07400.1 Acetyltransferase (isoleucine patch superfamily) [Belnapia rosea]
MIDQPAIDAIVTAHPALSGKVGQRGFTLPRIEDPVVIELDETARSRAAGHGYRIHGNLGDGNRIICGYKPHPANLSINFNGYSRNTIVAQPGLELKGSISFESCDNIVVLGRGWYSFSIRFLDNGGGIFFGENCSVGGAAMTIEGVGRSLCFGDAALLAWDISIFTGDLHAIFDLDSSEILNSPADVVLEPHCWLGIGALVMKGSRIGAGSIVAARSVVTGAIPARSLAAGVPAKVVRSNVTYTRSRQPDAGAMAWAARYSEGF